MCGLAGCCKVEKEPEVRNIIYMIGDGMGVAQITAAMIDGGYGPVNLERATAVGLLKTFSANDLVTDSAAGGTALATGTKTNNGTIGLGPQGDTLRSVLCAAASKGWATGLVVTSYITDATPASFYAHVPSRKMLDSIAVQFLDSGVDVAMGGGLSYFSPDRREDGRDLLAELRERGYTVATDFEETAAVTDGRLVGLFSETYMNYAQDGRDDYLSRATAKTLEILGNNSGDNGFLLMVEGSLIDYAGHDNDAGRVISEVRDFDRAVGVAFDYADRHPGTLVIVTADHETGGLTMPSGDIVAMEELAGIAHKFSSGNHSACMVPLFAYGTGAEALSRVMDNTEVAGAILGAIEGK